MLRRYADTDEWATAATLADALAGQGLIDRALEQLADAPARLQDLVAARRAQFEHTITTLTAELAAGQMYRSDHLASMLLASGQLDVAIDVLRRATSWAT